ncbi:hypothetical protein HPB50_001360 [Hyalomma asiaticum]|uniref:Uncharacterized protein n=1 Tax=Hyalomma asiaticum TaxID=266040 RepID=A0ACB7RR90_HYAAI|nr:hypothetical protein HPB50_001360 [Hyalomma asiaticum]
MQEVQLNTKKNVVAADAITPDWKDCLLCKTELAGVRVSARMLSNLIESSGIPQGIFGDCTEEELLAGVQGDMPLSASGRGFLRFAASTTHAQLLGQQEDLIMVGATSMLVDPNKLKCFVAKKVGHYHNHKYQRRVHYQELTRTSEYFSLYVVKTMTAVAADTDHTTLEAIPTVDIELLPFRTPDLQLRVVQEPTTTDTEGDQCCRPVLRHPPVLFLTDRDSGLRFLSDTGVKVAVLLLRQQFAVSPERPIFRRPTTPLFPLQAWLIATEFSLQQNVSKDFHCGRRAVRHFGWRPCSTFRPSRRCAYQAPPGPRIADKWAEKPPETPSAESDFVQVARRRTSLEFSMYFPR